jgi:cell division protein FtsL
MTRVRGNMAQTKRTIEDRQTGYVRPQRPAPASWRFETVRPYPPQVPEVEPLRTNRRTKKRTYTEPDTPKKSRRRDKAQTIDSINVSSIRYKYVPAKQKVSLVVLLTVVVALLVLIPIAMSAINASVQNDINKLNANIAAAKEDINEVTIEIDKSKDIGVIEKRARDELGMTYPEASQIVYLSDITLETPEDFAIKLKENAYGTE